MRGALHVEGPPGASGFASVARASGKTRTTILRFDDTGIARLNVPFGRAQLNRIRLGLGNGGTAGDPITIAYSLILPGSKKVAISTPTGPSATNFGTALRLSGRVECHDRPAQSADVLVTESELVSGKERVHKVETDEFGNWSVFVEPQANSTYVAKVVDPLLSSAISKPSPSVSSC